MREQTSPGRILIADDHRLVADACKSLLDPEFQVVGVVTDGRSLIHSAVELKPDLFRDGSFSGRTEFPLMPARSLTCFAGRDSLTIQR
jgi:hypothetical protein